MTRTLTLLATLSLLLLALLPAGAIPIGPSTFYFPGWGIPVPSTARYLGMGGTGVAAADDSGALDFNPANLGTAEIRPLGPEYDVPPTGPDGSTWTGEVAGTIELDGYTQLGGLRLMGFEVNPVHKKAGYGLSWDTYKDTTFFSNPSTADSLCLGYGHVYKYENWNWGLSVRHTTIGNAPANTIVQPLGTPALSSQTQTAVQFGLLWRIAMAQDRTLKVGAVVADLFNSTGEGPFYNLGVSVPLSNSLDLNADFLDLSKNLYDMVNVGVEWRATDHWALRAGVADATGDFELLTLGAGYKTPDWKFDLGYMGMRHDLGGEYVATVSRCF